MGKEAHTAGKEPNIMGKEAHTTGKEPNIAVQEANIAVQEPNIAVQEANIAVQEPNIAVQEARTVMQRNKPRHPPSATQHASYIYNCNVSHTRIYPKPEVMSPAGHWPQMHAAIEAGADAVYFGLHHFTARAKVGFDLAELPDVIKALHARGVRGYLTFNTLIFDTEMREAVRQIEQIAKAGTDAVIVQDIAIAKLAHEIAPDMEIHGSTQMSITSAEGIALAQQFGVQRVVLARELSLDEIRAIRAQTDCELEMFVHGALCVSYSGQCFSSEAWGGRSANRGQCAQACRLPYEMIVDGRLKPLGDARYLLSPGDLYAIPLMNEIVKLGVSSLKIEGRYKDEDYVALTTAAYRKAVDEAWAGLPSTHTKAEAQQLEQVYSRGLAPHFLQGTNHQTVVLGRSPRHRGVRMGKVKRVLADKGIILLQPDEAHYVWPLKPGDGVVFDAADWRSPQEAEEGGRLYYVKDLRSGEVELRFANNALQFERIRAGDWLWRSDDPSLHKAAQLYAQGRSNPQKQGLRVRLYLHAGEPMRIEASLLKFPTIKAEASSSEPLATAQNQGTNIEKIQQQLDRLGNTAYEIAALEVDQVGNPFVPASLLNQLRREVIDQISALQVQPAAWVIKDADNVWREHRQTSEVSETSEVSTSTAALHILVRTPEQLDAALALKQPPASITLDYLDLYGLRPAVERIQAAGITARVASPRVLKPNEQRVVNFLNRLNCEIVVRSTGLLYALVEATGATARVAPTSSSTVGTTAKAAPTHSDPVGATLAVAPPVAPTPPLIGDFSLNAANGLTAQTLLDLGLTRITPTYDLNAAQIVQLTQSIDADKIEVVAYMHLPVFHTEHCVFCRFLSNGTSYKDCGHPCEQHRVALRDVNGRTHPVMADVGCRNTVFGAEAQEISAHLDRLRATGIRHYRLEFVHEDGEQVAQVAQAFQRTLAYQQSPADLGRQLRQLSPQGTTEGSFFVN